MENPAHPYTNLELADIFRRIANLLEIKGEVIYKTLAYRKAADSLENLASQATEAWRRGQLTEIPGVGKAIAEKIDELFTTGKLEFLERLEQEIPPGLVDLLHVPDLGPKKAALFWKQAGVIDLASLEAAARAGKLRDLSGMGEKSEAKIISGLEALSRRSKRTPLGKAWPFAQELLRYLRRAPGVTAAEAAGSLRRMRATVGDLDLLAAAPDSRPVMDAFTSHPAVAHILARGEVKTSVEFTNGLRAQLWVHSPERYGTALQYATGSKDHNVRLRELALKQGLSLSDQAFLRQDGSEVLCATEEEVYSTLGLPWIPAELREDRGEVQAAKSGKLPALVRREDLLAELHAHTSWTDGGQTVRQMAEAAMERGLKLLAITDHTHSLGVANGLDVDRLRQQRQEIHAVQAELGGTIRLLQGAEVEIKAEGELDYPDEVLAELDLVIASLHTSLRQPRDKVTQRLLGVIRNPHVDIIGHPTGRLMPDREGADLDMDAVLAAAAESGVALEINAHPARLDLEDIYARRAAGMSIPLAINTDAHTPSDLDLVHFGIATARRGWVGPESVINAWLPERLESWLRSRGKG